MQGEVVDLYLKHNRNINQVPYSSSLYKDTTYYKPYIKYKYKYSGKEFIGTKISYSVHWTQSLTEASELLRGLERGGPVPVYIDPEKPERSVLLINDMMPVNLALIGALFLSLVESMKFYGR